MADPRFRVVFDTNIFIQAFLNPRGSAGKCFDLVREQEIMLCVSKAVLDEVDDVIARPTIINAVTFEYEEQKELFQAEIQSHSYFSDPIGSVFELLRDPDDEMLIDLAFSCEAHFIVTWDRDLLDLMTGIDEVCKAFRQKFRRLKVVRPNEFLRIVAESRSLSLKP